MVVMARMVMVVVMMVMAGESWHAQHGNGDKQQ